MPYVPDFALPLSFSCLSPSSLLSCVFSLMLFLFYFILSSRSYKHRMLYRSPCSSLLRQVDVCLLYCIIPFFSITSSYCLLSVFIYSVNSSVGPLVLRYKRSQFRSVLRFLLLTLLSRLSYPFSTPSFPFFHCLISLFLLCSLLPLIHSLLYPLSHSLSIVSNSSQASCKYNAKLH